MAAAGSGRPGRPEDDARTLITLLGCSANPDELATKVDLLALARQADVDVLKADVAELKVAVRALELGFARLGGEMKGVLIEQSRHHQRAMVALLSVYTAMVGTLVAIGAIIIS